MNQCVYKLPSVSPHLGMFPCCTLTLRTAGARDRDGGGCGIMIRYTCMKRQKWEETTETSILTCNSSSLIPSFVFQYYTQKNSDKAKYTILLCTYTCTHMLLITFKVCNNCGNKFETKTKGILGWEGGFTYPPPTYQKLKYVDQESYMYWKVGGGCDYM